MNKRIRKKQRERARRESAERYRQHPTVTGLLDHYNRFSEVLKPIPDISKPIQEAIETAKGFAAWLAEKAQIMAAALAQVVNDYLIYGPAREQSEIDDKQPIGLIDQREDESK